VTESLCNSFDDAKQTIAGEMEFIFLHPQEIMEENLHPIKKNLRKNLT
jgi:hypothetical protein